MSSIVLNVREVNKLIVLNIGVFVVILAITFGAGFILGRKKRK